METIGSLIDKITVFNLKEFHMSEQIKMKAHDKKHVKNCVKKLEIFNKQKNDLIIELNDLFADVKTGKKKIKVCRQFKMYNDPAYKLLSKS